MAKRTPAKASSVFAAYVRDALAPLGPVETRAMFGGHNVSLFGLTFGLIADDTLYLKVDAETVESFRAHGLGPFVFKTKDGKEMTMSYFAAPDALDDWEVLEPWVRGALAAAKRQRPTRPRAKKTAARRR